MTTSGASRSSSIAPLERQVSADKHTTTLSLSDALGCVQSLSTLDDAALQLGPSANECWVCIDELGVNAR